MKGVTFVPSMERLIVSASDDQNESLQEIEHIRSGC